MARRVQIEGAGWATYADEQWGQAEEVEDRGTRIVGLGQEGRLDREQLRVVHCSVNGHVHAPHGSQLMGMCLHTST